MHTHTMITPKRHAFIQNKCNIFLVLPIHKFSAMYTHKIARSLLTKTKQKIKKYLTIMTEKQQQYNLV